MIPYKFNSSKFSTLPKPNLALTRVLERSTYADREPRLSVPLSAHHEYQSLKITVNWKAILKLSVLSVFQLSIEL